MDNKYNSLITEAYFAYVDEYHDCITNRNLSAEQAEMERDRAMEQLNKAIELMHEAEKAGALVDEIVVKILKQIEAEREKNAAKIKRLRESLGLTEEKQALERVKKEEKQAVKRVKKNEEKPIKDREKKEIIAEDGL